MDQEFSPFDDWITQRQSCINKQNKHQSLDLLHVNIRSTHKNRDLLGFYTAKCIFFLDVIVLTEVNVDSSTIKQYQLDDFCQYHLCREKRKGGGLAIYVRKECLCQQTLLSFSKAEVTLLTIEKAQASYVIVVVYRPPGKNVLMFLHELEQLLIQLL